MTELVERGRAFREEVFTDEFLAVTGRHVLNAPDMAVGQYSLTNQRHVTQTTNVEDILQNGLRPDAELFDPEDEVFFRDEYAKQQQRVRAYGDDRLVEKYIFGNENDSPRGVYTTGDLDEGHIRGFAIPERTRFWLRNLHRLGTLPEAELQSRQHAEHLVQKYSGRLVVDGQISASVFDVDPKYPLLAKAVLGRFDYQGFSDDAFWARMIQGEQADTMMQFPEIPAKYLTLQGSRSYEAEPYLQEVLESTGQVVFNSPDYSRMKNPPEGYRG